MVVSWLAVTSGLLVLLSVFGLRTAAGGNANFNNAFSVTVPDHASEYPTRNYAGLFWSVSEVRHTPSQIRPCAQGTQLDGCDSVVVVEAIVTNSNDKAASVSVKDVSLAFPEGTIHAAERFDCSAASVVKSVESSVKDLQSVCPQPGDGFVVAPRESRLVSILFIPDASSLPDLEEVDLYIQESHRQMALPATLPLAGTVSSSTYPIAGAVDLQIPGQPMVNPDDPSTQITIEPEFIQIDVNHGDYRVKKGNRLVLAQVAIKRVEEDIPASLLQPKFWSLQVDNMRIHPDLIELEASNAGYLILRFSFESDEDFTEEEGVELALFAGDSSTDEESLSFPLRFS